MSVFPSSKTRILGDFEFIQNKVLDGDYFQISGDINNLNDTIEFIVPDLRTAFMINAKIMIPIHPSGAGFPLQTTINQKNLVTADFKIDSVIKDKTTIGEATTSYNSTNSFGGGGGNGYGDLGDGKFDVLGLSLVGDGIKKVEIENILDNGSAFATMAGYLV